MWNPLQQLPYINSLTTQTILNKLLNINRQNFIFLLSIYIVLYRHNSHIKQHVYETFFKVISTA